ncbi:hypothetical protein AB0G35_16025 [Streptomyces sp. NPDC021749]|uniref:hypothetical protein n=1 Tax=Streptomyces sp. NPDC021749 TaxID=3154905 RepID=UPI0033CEA67A
MTAAARTRSVGLHGMSACRSTGATAPAQLVLGFGDLGERAITAGIAAIGELLSGQDRGLRAGGLPAPPTADPHSS